MIPNLLTEAMTAAEPTADEYYLQDSRSYVGNDMLFWGKACNGYTTDLNKAQVFSKDEALRRHKARNTDIPWPAAYIQERTRPAVDFQYCKLAEALEHTGIEITKPRRELKHVTNCCGCGKFLSDVQRYCDGGCPHCGKDNRP